MKAAPKVHRSLIEAGFGYDEGFYMQPLSKPPLVAMIQPLRHRQGLLFGISVAYECAKTALQLQPTELSILRKDGSIGQTPDTEELYFAPSDTGRMLEVLSGEGRAGILKFSDAHVMLSTLRYLMGDSEEIPEFSSLSTPFIQRRPTPLRVLQAAGYHNVASRFPEAIRMIDRLSESDRRVLSGGHWQQILADAERESLEFPEASQSYLDAVGAKRWEVG